MDACQIIKSTGNPDTDKAVLNSLATRRYTPEMQDGKPIAVTKVFNVRIDPTPSP